MDNAGDNVLVKNIGKRVLEMVVEYPNKKDVISTYTQIEAKIPYLKTSIVIPCNSMI